MNIKTTDQYKYNKKNPLHMLWMGTPIQHAGTGCCSRMTHSAGFVYINGQNDQIYTTILK